MASRKGLIASHRIPVESIPEPNRHIPQITAEVRVYFPPNVTREQVYDAIEAAITDICDQVAAEDLPESR